MFLNHVRHEHDINKVTFFLKLYFVFTFIASIFRLTVKNMHMLLELVICYCFKGTRVTIEYLSFVNHKYMGFKNVLLKCFKLTIFFRTFIGSMFKYLCSNISCLLIDSKEQNSQDATDSFDVKFNGSPLDFYVCRGINEGG